jgi:hypothetical protein
MTMTSLMPPADVTWTRMAFARDMVDTNFGDLAFSPKWRSSLAVYYYIVPDEETTDAYPNSRIVYLKFTCSITGWNPSEALLNAQQLASEVGNWDDLQRTLWQTIIASGWATKYWPCLGAIMQLAVYPRHADGVPPDDYPYFLDFEPKKRELYEAVTDGAEVLSGSADKTSITKGSTSVSSTEFGGSAGFSIGGFGASASAKQTSTDTTVNQNTTDTSREARETLSHTTSSSQMYQLFNGYHLGSNRALFVVAPRPHTVGAASQTEFNLIDGERKLEGIQDVFLVVHLPRSLDGFCIQAGLDTGHQAPAVVPQYLLAVARQPNGGGGDWENPPNPPPTPPTPPTAPVKQLVITRRLIQACGTFDQSGEFVLDQVREPFRNVITGEIALPDRVTMALARTRDGDGSADTRVNAARDLNVSQSEVNRLMLDSISSGAYEPKPFEESVVFRSLVATIASAADVPLQTLATAGHVSLERLDPLARSKITTVGQLFSPSAAGPTAPEATAAQRELLDSLLSTKKA